MIPHDTLVAAKAGLLETLVRDMFVDRMMETADPIQSLANYAEARLKRVVPKPEDADVDLVYETVWGEFLDGARAQIVRRLSERK